MDLDEYCAFKKKKAVQLFHRTDNNLDGKITEDELDNKHRDIFVNGLGYAERAKLFEKYDEDNNKNIDIDGKYDITGSYGRVCLTSQVLIPRWIWRHRYNPTLGGSEVPFYIYGLLKMIILGRIV